MLISISRIFLCVHYPTDVLGGIVEGAVLGVAVTIVGRIILNKLERWWIDRKQKRAPVTQVDESPAIEDKSIQRKNDN